MKLVFKTCAACFTAGIVIAVGATNSSSKSDARVTQIIKDVQLLPAGSTPRPAVPDDQVSENTAVRTGDESRSELTFEDMTITRLGANTIFSFNKAGRSGELESGAILLRVPKNSGGAEFRTKAVTVGVTGTTVIFESTRLGNANLIVMEGGARLRLNQYPNEFKKVRAGQVLRVQAGAVKLPEPEHVDLDQVMKTNPLFTDFPPLPSDDLIRTTIKKQSGGTKVAPVSQATPTPAPIVTRPTATPRFFPTATPTPRIFPTRTPRPRPRPTKPPGTSGNNSPTVTPTATPKGVGPTRPPRGTGGTRFTPTPTPSASPTILLRRATKGQKKPTPTPTPPAIR